RRAFLGEAGRSAGPTASRAGGEAGGSSYAAPAGRTSRHDAPPRWFAAGAASDEPPAAPGTPATAYAAPFFVLGALLSTVLVHGNAARVLLPISLLALAGAAAWQPALRRLRPSPPGPAPRSSRGLELDGERLAFHPGRSVPPASARGRGYAPVDTLLLLLDAPFGVTLLSSPRRDRLIALLTSASGTFFLGAAFDAAARRAFAPLLDRAYTVAGDDAGIEPVGPDGEQLALPPDELASLLDTLVERSPACLDRFVLTDARGASLTLDSRQLCVGDRSVDLNAPLEWKPIVFQEAFGQAIAVYQGTWVRQSSTELVLV